MSTEIRLCGECGANLPRRFETCELCGGKPGTHAAPAPVAGVSWVQLRVRMWCRQCQQKSPMSFLSEGAFYCTGCQQDRELDPEWWYAMALPIAGAAADAFWGNAGVFPPWPKFGPGEDLGLNDLVAFVCSGLASCVGQKHAGQSVEGRRGNDLLAAPGHPLCPACMALMTAAITQRGRATIECAACKTRDTYEAPASALARCPELVGVVAPEHAVGYVGARVERNATAVSVTCPSCSAPVAVARGTRLTRCAHCQASVLIPDRLAEPARVPHPLWAAFVAPSAVRLAASGR